MSGIKKYYYLFEFQYLGFRYHGWQKQPGVKTVQLMVEKTMTYVLGHDEFKIMSVGRTDSMVSANQTTFELFTRAPIDLQGVFEGMNKNLPQDIRILNAQETNSSFNIIQSAKTKEYNYFFSFGEKVHPFTSPFLFNLMEEVDLELMKEGAKLFEGEHDFSLFTYRPKEKTKFVRSVDSCLIEKNTELTASFFPEKSYVLKVKGTGFIRYQIRFMMGTLFNLGLGKITLEDIQVALTGVGEEPIGFMAPASGLTLNEVVFTDES